MSEPIHKETTQQFDIERYLEIIGRRHLLLLTIFFVTWAAVWGSGWFLPPRYKSSTLILVEEPTMPRNYVVPNINDDLQERLQSIEQQILSRTRLLLIINKLHLYTGKSSGFTPDEKINLMRKDIDIELVRNPQNQAITAFKIYYSAPDPHVAQQVTNELTNLFIDENMRVRKQESEDTTNFLEGQLAGASANLADQEAQVREFQMAHEGELPSQEASNLQILSGLQSELQSEEDALNTAKQQATYYQSLIGQYRAFESAPATATGVPTELSTINQQLETLRSQLADLSGRYTDRYPQVEQLKNEIAGTEKRREGLIASLKKNASNRDRSASTSVSEVDPAQNAPVLQLESQLDANKIEIANREQAIANLTRRMNDYRTRLSEEPAVEQRLADLTRGYDQSKANYDDLLKKHDESQMATSMEQMREGERFTMLDPPSLPIKPDFPNRLKLCGVGVGAGLGLAALLIGILEYLDDRLRSDAQIKMLLPIAVISEIPEIASPRDATRKRCRTLLGWAMTTAVIIIVLAGAAFSYVHA